MCITKITIITILLALMAFGKLIQLHYRLLSVGKASSVQVAVRRVAGDATQSNLKKKSKLIFLTKDFLVKNLQF